MQRDGGRVGRPAFHSHARDYDLGTERVLDALLQIDQRRGWEPTLDHEQIVSGKDAISCVESQQRIVQEHPNTGEPLPLGACERLAIGFQRFQSM